MAFPALEAIQADHYLLASCQAIVYDPKDSFFPEDFIPQLYQGLKGDMFSRKDQDGTGLLQYMFCGMQNLSFNSIVAYLAARPIIVVGVWEDSETYKWAGFGFPSIVIGKPPEVACFAGYGMFPQFWGSEYSELLGMVGLAAMFMEWKVKAIHGFRFKENAVTARWTRRFGFRDVGTLERYLVRDEQLVGATVSSLMIEDFEDYCEDVLSEAYG